MLGFLLKTTIRTRSFSTRSRHRPAGAVSASPSSILRLTSSLPARFTGDDLASLLSRTGDAVLCLHLFRWASAQPRFRHSPSSYLATIRKLASAGMFPAMDDVASLALSSPTPNLLHSLLLLFSRARMLSRAASVYRRMRDHPDPAFRPTLQTYHVLLSALALDAAHVPSLTSIFRQMLDRDIRPDAFALGCLIRGYVVSDRIDDALRVFRRMDEPDPVACGLIVHGLCAAGRVVDARELAGEMEGKGFELGERAGNSLASALAMDGESAEAVRVVWGLVARGRRVEAVTCGAVVGGLCREGRLREAAELVGALRRRGIVSRRVAVDLRKEIGDVDGDGPR